MRGPRDGGGSTSAERSELLALLLKEEFGDTAAVKIPPRPGAGPAPLSFAQERLWFLDQLAPRNAFYNVDQAQRVPFWVDADVLGRAVDVIVARHESLRTRFVTVDGEPRQEVLSSLRVDVPVHDLRGLPAEERRRVAERMATEEARRPFDLSTGPLLRISLVRTGDAETVLLLTMHHIITDGWSMQILFSELHQCYTALTVGQAPELEPLPLQYADYAVWQRERLSGELLDAEIAYWQRRLDGLPVLNLSTDRPRPAVQKFAGDVLDVCLAAAPIREFARRRDATPFMVLMAAFAALLARYTNQDDIAVGVPIAGRLHSELEPLIGLFVNTAVLRADLAGDPTFAELLERIRGTAVDALAHQELSFEKLVEELGSARDLSRNPLCQVAFQVFSEMTTGAEPQPRDAEELNVNRGSALFDLSLAFWERADEFAGRLEFNTDLFDRETAQRFTRHYQVMLTAALANPGNRVSCLPLLDPDEQRQLAAFNATDAPYPARCIHALFEEQCVRTPDAVAASFEGREMSYRELDEQANKLAHHLRRLGARPGVLVGIRAERSLELLIGVLATLKAGGAYVPLDPAYPPARLRRIVEDAEPAVVLDTRAWPDVSAEPPTPPPPLASLDDLAYVIYTSGSTGEPKGAMNAHRALTNRLAWMRRAYDLGPRDRVLQKTPFGFDVSVWELLLPLIAGARVVFARPEGHRDAAYLCDLIRSEQITLLHFVPSMLGAFLEEPAARECQSPTRIICSGEALPPELRTRCLDTLNADLHNLYGPTEAAIDVTAWACSREDRRPFVSIGRPIDNVRVRVLDRYGALAPIGVPGELHIGGVAVGRGYWRRPELTAERFIADLEEPGGRLYRTGDLARWLPDGSLEFLGRLDHQVKLRGFRIELGEIESALRSHPAIQDAVVVARGEGDECRLVAYVVGDVVYHELRQSLAETLPEQMVPAVYVRLDALPLTPSGKVDRRTLPDPDHAGHPVDAAAHVPPRTDLERVLAAIWSEVLRVQPIGVHDDFFDLGGHSLLATRVMARVHARLETDVPLQTLFQAPTVAGLAAAVERHRGGPATDAITRLPDHQDGTVMDPENMSDEEVSAALTALLPQERDR